MKGTLGEAMHPHAPTRYTVGDRVTVKPGQQHDAMTKGKTGTVTHIATAALGITFDGMDGVHKWYVDAEVAPQPKA